MISGLFVTLKSLLMHVWMIIAAFFCIAAAEPAVQSQNRIVVNTVHMVNNYRSDFKKYVSSVHSQLKLSHGAGKIPLFGKVFVGAGAGLMGYTQKHLDNAAIVWPFFKSGAYNYALDGLGTKQDIDYIQAVFQEFFSRGGRSLDMLIDIMHKHMVKALGLPSYTTIEQFRSRVKKLNKRGRCVNLSDAQWNTYVRMIPCNLFISYWHKNFIK